MSDAYTHTFCIDADHPCLPGHFPGLPLVPGTLLLEQLATALHAWRGLRLARIMEAKFLAPLAPAQTAQVHLTGTADQLRFEIRREGQVLARGAVQGERT